MAASEPSSPLLQTNKFRKTKNLPQNKTISDDQPMAVHRRIEHQPNGYN